MLELAILADRKCASDSVSASGRNEIRCAVIKRPRLCENTRGFKTAADELRI
jgi:hypothetical protein